MNKFKLLIAAGLICPAVFASDAPEVMYSGRTAESKIAIEPESEDPTADFPLIIFVGFDESENKAFTDMVRQSGTDCYVMTATAVPTALNITMTMDRHRIDPDRVYVITRVRDKRNSKKDESAA